MVKLVIQNYFTKQHSLLLISFFLIFCSNDKSTHNSIEVYQPNQKFNSYWYDGSAEITSYKLSQLRYGEVHEGTAVNIFVTEDFLPGKQVKADYRNDNNIPILKLNSTKKFITGVYPYSIMTSTFSPVNTNEQAIKISYSSQEWCGNTFAQLNNRNNFIIDYHSYFQSDADRKIELNRHPLENDVWNLIRIAPEKLPTGKLKMIPSFEYFALNHIKIGAYDAEIQLVKKVDFTDYVIHYPNLSRTLTITFKNDFPHIIEGWQESRKGRSQPTKAVRIETIKSKYWSKNSKKDKKTRKTLGI